MPILKNLKHITQRFFLFWLMLGYRHLPLNYQTKEKIKFYFFKKFPGLKKQKSHALRCPLCLFVKSIWNKYTPLLFNLLNPAALLIKFKPYLIYEAKHIGLKGSNKPLVSIIIPIYGQIGFTIRCLKSISLNLPKCSFEIIVIDDASKDNSLDILKFIKGIKVFKNATNRGFIYSCNFGAKKAKGNYLYFLNNDTEVTSGWLDHLVQSFKDFPGSGLVGSKLIYPNGKLQEAGGIIGKDGSAWNFGRYQDPNDPVFNYAREVDYCSGASIMIPKTIFNKMKGFDPYYSPAYGEDSDLALKLRDRGYRVIYQPLSTVIHFEGMTSGKSIMAGTKSYQTINQKKLFKRWKIRLQSHGLPRNLNTTNCRRSNRRVLIIDHCTPMPDQDAGSITVFNLMLLLREMDFQVTFVPEDNYLYMPEYTSALQRSGIEVLYAPYVTNLEQHLKSCNDRYDLAFLFRPGVAMRHLKDIRKFCPNAKILYHTVDLHFLRMSREAELQSNKAKQKAADEMKQQELEAIVRADGSIVHSSIEFKILKLLIPNSKLFKFPLIMDAKGTKKIFTERRDIVFIGGYQHIPNVDAVKYFIKEIMPLLRKQLPGVRFFVVGSQVPAEIKNLASKDVIVTGYVKDLMTLLDKMRISVVPLRYGAGIKGKIGTAMAAGLPIVGTTIAAEGMSLKHGENILIADGPTQFANEIINLYEDEVLWNLISRKGLVFADKSWGAEASWNTLHKILAKLSIATYRSRYPLSLYSERVS